jgi:hypothetical protein
MEQDSPTLPDIGRAARDLAKAVFLINPGHKSLIITQFANTIVFSASQKV